jgi:hypothetical protein
MNFVLVFFICMNFNLYILSINLVLNCNLTIFTLIIF